MTATAGLRVLLVQDTAEQSLIRLLRAMSGIRRSAVAGSSLAAIRLVQAEKFDLVVIDAELPELNGLELGRLVTRLDDAPAVAILAEDDTHAAAAYELGAIDYLCRPVPAERLAEAVRRCTLVALGKRSLAELATAAHTPRLPAIPVHAEGVVQYVRREDVHFVEARGNRIRLHTMSGQHEARVPLSTVEEFWRGTGLLRVHRSFLVSVGAIRELRIDSVGGAELIARTDLGDVAVSRKNTRVLRAALREHGMPG